MKQMAYLCGTSLNVTAQTTAGQNTSADNSSMTVKYCTHIHPLTRTLRWDSLFAVRRAKWEQAEEWTGNNNEGRRGGGRADEVGEIGENFKKEK